MAMGGGGSAQYQADFVINTRQAEASLKQLGLSVQRTLTGVQKGVNADIGQSLREAGRVQKTLGSALKKFEMVELIGSKRQKAAIKPIRDFNSELGAATTKLSDLRRQGRASTKDLEELYQVFQRFSRSKSLKAFDEFDTTRKAIGARVRHGKKFEALGATEADTLAAAKANLAQQRLEQASQRAAARAQRARERATAQAERAATQATRLAAKAKRDEEARVAAIKKGAAAEIAARNTTENALYRQKAREENQRNRARVQEAARRKRFTDVGEREDADNLKRSVKALQDEELARHRTLQRGAAARAALRQREDREAERALVEHNRQQARAVQTPARTVSGAGAARTVSGAGAATLKPVGLVRGQEMPMRPAKQAHELLQLSSAAQGAMLAFSALDGNVTGLAFGLVFLSYGLVGTALKMAALTTVVIGLKRAVMGLSAVALTAGKAFEESGQQMANWFQSGKEAMDFKARNIQTAKTFGVVTSEVDKLEFALRKAGLQGDVYTKAVLNAAAATGENPSDIASRFSDIMKARPEQRGNMVQQFAKDMNIPVKNYASSLELAEALNKRFANSASAMATTTAGKIRTMSATWNEFKINLGVLLNEYLKPFVDVATSLFQGMVDGYKDAFKASAKTGELKKAVDGLQISVRKLAPYLHAIGVILGRVIFRGAILAAQGIKVLTDALRGALKFAKEYKDEFVAAGTSFKKNFLDVLVSAPTVTVGVLTFIKTFIAGIVEAFKGTKIHPKVEVDGVEFVAKNADDVSKGFVKGIMDSIASIPKNIFKGALEGLKAGLVFALLEALALTTVDLLPFSDSVKTSLEGAVRMGFMGAAIGSVVPGVGTGLGAAIALSIATALELIKPGLSKTVMDWIDDTIIKTVRAGVKIIADILPKPKEPVMGPPIPIEGPMPPPDYKAPQPPDSHAVQLWKDFEKLLHGLGRAADFLWTNFKAGIALFMAGLLPILKLVGEGFYYLEHGIKLVTVEVIDLVKNIKGGEVTWEVLGKALLLIGKTLLQELILPVLREIKDFIVGVFNGALEDLSRWWDNVSSAASTTYEALKKVGGYLDGPLTTGFSSTFTWLSTLYDFINDKLIGKFEDLVTLGLKAVKGALDELNNMITSPLTTIARAAESAYGWVKLLWEWIAAIPGELDKIHWPEPPQWVKDIWNKGGSIIGALTPGGSGNYVDPFAPKTETGVGERPSGRFAAGGMVGRDRAFPITASPGELILNAAQQRSVATQLAGGGGGTHIYISVSDSVITNQAALEEFTGKVASKIASRIGSAKSLTFHRVSS